MLGFTTVPVDVAGSGRQQMDPVLAAMAAQRLGGLMVVGDPTLGVQRNRIAELALANKLPSSGSHRAWTDAGLLMSYGTDFVDLFRRGAGVVEKVLKGARPDTLPVEQPTKFELVISLKPAKGLGLTVPQSVLRRADRVIE